MDLLKKYNINKNDIDCVNIYLDDNVPEYMSDIYRIGSVIVEANGKDFDIQELVENDEFYSSEEIENFVNKKLNINFANVI